MGVSTYPATWSAGGWRSVPRPFGFMEVRDDGIAARSRHWSWWVKDQEIERDSIEVIRAVRQVGTTTLAIHRRSRKPVSFNVPGADADLMVRELQARGYVVDGLAF